MHPSLPLVTPVVALAALLLAAAPARPASPIDKPLSMFDGGQVERARQAAMVRLRTSECQRVLSDFSDTAGRPLAANLERRGVTPDAYLETLEFSDGSSHPACANGIAFMVTSVYRPGVLVCKGFVKAVFAERRLAEAVMIHEMLHTLGLSENPPTSQEITQQVLRRCVK
jgi:hypothetical protein